MTRNAAEGNINAMREDDLDLEVSRLDECRISSPMSGIHFVADDEPVLYHSNLMEIEAYQEAGERPPCFDMADPRDLQAKAQAEGETKAHGNGNRGVMEWWRNE